MDTETKLLLRPRIDYLIARLNSDDALSKRDRRAIYEELNGYGIIVLREPQEIIVDVRVPIDGIIDKDELTIKSLHINGRLPTSEGTIIGYYCKDCYQYSNVKEKNEIIIYDPMTQIWECIACCSQRIEPIYEQYICDWD